MFKKYILQNKCLFPNEYFTESPPGMSDLCTGNNQVVVVSSGFGLRNCHEIEAKRIPLFWE
jgi:hypothetical protein